MPDAMKVLMQTAEVEVKLKAELKTSGKGLIGLFSMPAFAKDGTIYFPAALTNTKSY